MRRLLIPRPGRRLSRGPGRARLGAKDDVILHLQGPTGPAGAPPTSSRPPPRSRPAATGRSSRAEQPLRRRTTRECTSSSATSRRTPRPRKPATRAPRARAPGSPRRTVDLRATDGSSHSPPEADNLSPRTTTAPTTTSSCGPRRRHHDPGKPRLGAGGAGGPAARTTPAISPTGATSPSAREPTTLRAGRRRLRERLRARPGRQTTTLIAGAPAQGLGPTTAPSTRASRGREPVAFRSLGEQPLQRGRQRRRRTSSCGTLAAARVTLVSRATGSPGPPRTTPSDSPASPLGRFVTFKSTANNLSPDDETPLQRLPA